MNERMCFRRRTIIAWIWEKLLEIFSLAKKELDLKSVTSLAYHGCPVVEMCLGFMLFPFTCSKMIRATETPFVPSAFLNVPCLLLLLHQTLSWACPQLTVFIGILSGNHFTSDALDKTFKIHTGLDRLSISQRR